KPASSKGTYIKTIAVSTTMGPGISIDTAQVKELGR
nr:50S ribosomal protein L1 [Deltaproteobacteria bacterium]